MCRLFRSVEPTRGNERPYGGGGVGVPPVRASWTAINSDDFVNGLGRYPSAPTLDASISPRPLTTRIRVPGAFRRMRGMTRRSLTIRQCAVEEYEVEGSGRGADQSARRRRSPRLPGRHGPRRRERAGRLAESRAHRRQSGWTGSARLCYWGSKSSPAGGRSIREGRVRRMGGSGSSGGCHRNAIHPRSFRNIAAECL